jgi:glyoxylase-like metal-dependent hydrolase (beta-lactamase superfamily II)
VHLRELRPRLWYWTALHPDWRPEQGGADGWEQEVGCYAYVALDEQTLALFDPLAPDGWEEEFWRALDADVEHHGPPHVLITVWWHARSSAQLLDRYDGARVWAYAPARDELAKWTPVTDVFAVGDALPAAVEALPAGGEDNEVAFRLPEHEAVVFGDALAAAPGAPVRVWEGDADSLRALLERPLSLLLLTHGEPVLEGGGEALALALEG